MSTRRRRPIFTKGHLLFNLDRARTAVGEGRPFVMVEGQLDALRCWSVGLRTAVAPQGTSITDGQIALLRRYHFEVECFFDSDAAGQKAALRMLPMALKAGLEVRFLTLDGDAKVDPDLLFLERGIAAYEEVRKDVALGDGVRVPGLAPRARNGVVRAEVPRRAGRPGDHRRGRERGLALGLRVRGRGAPAPSRPGAPERPEASLAARRPRARRPAAARAGEAVPGGRHARARPPAAVPALRGARPARSAPPFPTTGSTAARPPASS